MQRKPTPGDNARDRTEAPPSEKFTTCAFCGDPADGLDARFNGPTCRRCATATPARYDVDDLSPGDTVAFEHQGEVVQGTIAVVSRQGTVRVRGAGAVDIAASEVLDVVDHADGRRPVTDGGQDEPIECEVCGDPADGWNDDYDVPACNPCDRVVLAA